MLLNDHGQPGPRHQRGATFLGMLTIIAILGFALYGGIRLTPLYLEYMNVARAMEQVSTEFSGQAITANTLYNSLGRQWEVNDIESLDPREIEIHKEGDEFLMRAFYRAEAPFVANVSLVVDFDKTVSIPQ